MNCNNELEVNKPTMVVKVQVPNRGRKKDVPEMVMESCGWAAIKNNDQQ